VGSSLITVILVVAPVGASDPAPEAMARTLRQALGPDVTVAVESRSSSPSDDEALSLRPKAEGSAVAEVIFQDDARGSARVRVYLEPRRAWVDHVVEFDPADALIERERTIGFTIASMLPEPLLERQPVAPPPAVAGARAQLGAFDASVVGAAAVGGSGGGVGADLGASLSLSPHVAVRLALGARAGEVEAASATSNLVQGGLGLRLGQYGSERSRLVWGARADVLVTRFELIHLSPDDDAPRHQVRWLPAAALTGEIGWAFAETAAVVVHAGGEAIFGRTSVVVHEKEVATISPWRAVAGTGFLVRF
jgi:hypothetical protein